MKLYQKILIGIAAGALFGALLGPQSPLLTKDGLHVVDPAKLELRARIDDPSSRIALPPRHTVDFRVEQELAHSGQRWYRVSWTLKSRHLLARGLPKGGDGKRLQAGQRATAYLRADTAPGVSATVGLKVMSWVNPLAEVFLRLILMLVVPVIFTTLVVGVASVGNVKSLGRLGARTLVYFVVTTSIAVAIGIGLLLLVGPGTHVGVEDASVLAAQFRSPLESAVAQATRAPDLKQFLVEIVPDNPLHAMAGETPNLLQVMFFAVLFGVALTLLPKQRSRQVLNLLDRLSRALMMVMHMVMQVAPFGVACLIAQAVGYTGGSVLGAIGLYLATVIAALLLYAGVVLNLVVGKLTDVRIRDFWRAIWPAQLLALGTVSSAATLPVTLECTEQNLGVSNRVSSFVIPLGATINMDGTALFQAAAAVFIAQAFGVELSFNAISTLFAATVLGSIAPAGVPSSGLIGLAVVLSVLGVPPEGLALIVGIDRLVEMVRTVINVASDAAGALVMARLSGEKVRVLSPEADAGDPHRGFEKRLDVPQQPYTEQPDPPAEQASDDPAPESR